MPTSKKAVDNLTVSLTNDMAFDIAWEASKRYALLTVARAIGPSCHRGPEIDADIERAREIVVLMRDRFGDADTFLRDAVRHRCDSDGIPVPASIEAGDK